MIKSTVDPFYLWSQLSQLMFPFFLGSITSIPMAMMAWLMSGSFVWPGGTALVGGQNLAALLAPEDGLSGGRCG